MMMKATSKARALVRLTAVRNAFGGSRKPRGLAGLGGIALHHRDGVEHFGGDGAGVRHAVLAVA